MTLRYRRWFICRLGSAAAVWLTLSACSSLSGNAPQASSPTAKTSQDSGSSSIDPTTLSLYQGLCSSCHGAYANLTAAAGQKNGMLVGATAADIQTYCAKLPPQASPANLSAIAAALVKLGKGPATRSKAPTYPPPLSPVPSLPSPPATPSK